MALNLRDRWLWLGLGAFLFIASRGIAHGLSHIVEINTVEDGDPLAQPAASPGPEDTIKESTLSVLTQSPNGDISASAIGLLIDRFIKSNTRNTSWIHDLFSELAKTRKRAQQFHEMMASHRFTVSVPLPSMDDYRHLIELSVSSESASARTIRQVYRHALRMHLRRSKGNGDDANVIYDSRKRGFRSPLDEFHALSEYMESQGSTQIIVCPILTEAQILPWMQAMRLITMRNTPARDQKFVRALRAFNDAADGEGHVEEEGSDEEADQDVGDAESSVSDPGELFVGSGRRGFEGLDGDADNFPLRHRDVISRRPRFHEESPEEAELRRRRREAMVLHEGAGTVDREDIIHPRTS